jgi:hypothetical protein
MKRINRNLRRYAEKGYIGYLERIEVELYDDREELIEEKLASLAGLPLPPPVEGFIDAPFYRIHATMALIPALVRFALLKWRQRRLTQRAKASVAIRSA